MRREVATLVFLALLVFGTPDSYLGALSVSVCGSRGAANRVPQKLREYGSNWMGPALFISHACCHAASLACISVNWA